MNEKMSITYILPSEKSCRTECKNISLLSKNKKYMICIEKCLECFIQNLTLATLENGMEGGKGQRFFFSHFLYGLMFSNEHVIFYDGKFWFKLYT